MTITAAKKTERKSAPRLRVAPRRPRLSTMQIVDVYEGTKEIELLLPKIGLGLLFACDGDVDPHTDQGQVVVEARKAIGAAYAQVQSVLRSFQGSGVQRDDDADSDRGAS